MKGSAQKRLLLGNQCKEQYCVVQTKNPDPAGPAWPSGLSCGFSCSLRKVPGSIPGAAISVRTAASVLGLVAGSRLRQTCTVCRSRRFYDLGAEFGTLQAPFRMHSRFRMPDLGVGFGRPGPIPDGFGTHSRFKMPDLGVQIDRTIENYIQKCLFLTVFATKIGAQHGVYCFQSRIFRHF